MCRQEQRQRINYGEVDGGSLEIVHGITKPTRLEQAQGQVARPIEVTARAGDRHRRQDALAVDAALRDV